MNRFKQEFHRFGPWAYEISSIDPVPDYFQSILKDNNFLMSIKIPRPIDRYRVSPGMELYDFMINLSPKELQILHRTEIKIEEKLIDYQDILALGHSADMLSGDISIFTADDTICIPYSTVSTGLMNRLIEKIKELMDLSTREKPAEGLAAEECAISFLFRNLLAKQKEENPELTLVAYQPEMTLAPYHRNGWHRMKHRLMNTTLLESMHLYNGKELNIWNRIVPINNWKKPVLGKACLMIPMDRLENLKWESDPQYPRMEFLSWQAMDRKIQFPFMKSNSCLESYKNFLA